MGDPKRKRKKYETPTQKWNKARIEQERTIMKEYGLRNKREIWKTQSILRKFTTQAKRLTRTTGKQRELEEKQMMEKLKKLGLFNTITTLENVLGLTINNILDRRLQTIVFKKGMASSPNQARQFITHGHICIGDKKVSVPSYLVPTEEESGIKYKETSSIAKESHPETSKLKKVKKQIENKETSKIPRKEKNEKRR
ncbi:MAG: 30S ribosomal protein S4 [Nanoarchaeota archaeon]|nr:30S ribosomal protein S4 [Nanoarchaeota archaeon]